MNSLAKIFCCASDFYELRVEETEGEEDDAEVELEEALGLRILNLHDDVAAVEKGGFVNLPDAGGAYRLGIDSREHFADRPLKL